MRRSLERLAEKALTLAYREADHAEHYRRVMLVRSLIRGFAGMPLTNTPEDGLPIYEQLAAIIGFDGTQDILDFGCGEAGVGIHFARALTSGTYHGVDISPPALETADRRLSSMENAKVSLIIQTGDVHGQFDFIIAQSVFTHCPLSVLGEFLDMARRCLKPKGTAYVTFAVSDMPRQIAQTDYIYSVRQIESVARSRGFNSTIVEEWVHPTQAKRAPDAPVDTLFRFTTTN